MLLVSQLVLAFGHPLSGSGKEEFSMLGLGDIVIPGIFVALVLRYDVAHGRQTRFFTRYLLV